MVRETKDNCIVLFIESVKRTHILNVFSRHATKNRYVFVQQYIVDMIIDLFEIIGILKLLWEKRYRHIIIVVIIITVIVAK